MGDRDTGHSTDGQPERRSDTGGLRLAREAGEAYRRQVDHFIEQVAGWSAARQRAGEYEVGLAFEEAEPPYHVAGWPATTS